MEAIKQQLINRGLLLSFEDWCKEHKTLLNYGNLPRAAEEYYNEYVTETVTSYWEAYNIQASENSPFFPLSIVKYLTSRAPGRDC